MSVLQDKKAIINVLSAIVKKPELLSNAKEYKLERGDFPEPFHQIIFNAIYNLYQLNAEKITKLEIDSYLKDYPRHQAIFEDNDGWEYLERLNDIDSVDNYNYYYERVKKFSLLRECRALGFDTSEFYNSDSLDFDEAEKAQEKFNTMTLSDIVKAIELKLIEIKDQFISNSETTSELMSDGIDELLEASLESPSFGVNLGSRYLTTVTRGAKLKKFYLRSAPTGGGKTRYNLADLLEICIPERYESDIGKWVQTGADGKGLFITTELSKEEIQLPTLCYIADVDEDKLKDKEVSFEEIERLNLAKAIMKRSGLRIEHLPDFDLEEVELSIERNILKYDIEYVVFDYIHTSLNLMTSIAKKANLREDQILLILSDKLKQLSVKYEIFMLSSTQMNDNWKQDDMKNLDQSSIRGSKAIADKVDFGCILLPIFKKDKELYDELKTELGGFNKEPTHTINVYKNRGGKWNNIRIWLHIDMGTLRTTDCFVTTRDGDLVTNILPKSIVREPKKIEEPVVEEIAEEVVEEIAEAIKNEPVRDPNTGYIETEKGIYDDSCDWLDSAK